MLRLLNNRKRVRISMSNHRRRRRAELGAQACNRRIALGNLTRSALWGDAFVQGAWLQDCTHKCFDPFYFEPLWWALHLVVVTYAERLGWPVVDPRQQAAALGHLRGNKHHGFACVSSAG